MGTVVDTDRVLVGPVCLDLLRAGQRAGVVGAQVEHPTRGPVDVVGKETGAQSWAIGPCPLCGAETDTAIRHEMLLYLLSDAKPTDLGSGADERDPAVILETKP